MSNTFSSSHGLDFEITVWIMSPYLRFRIGTCNGLWRSTETAYEILAIGELPLPKGGGFRSQHSN